MTMTDVSQVPVAVRRLGVPIRLAPLVAAVTGVLTLAIRLALHQGGFDLYGDEVVYTNLGRSVISGGFPSFEGQVFFLHGPAFFYLEAGWARLAGAQPDLISWVYLMRILNALLAGGTAVTVVLLGTRIFSLRAGVVAGVIFAVDPFCIRQNDRVLLETSMMFWVLLGYLVFVPLVGRLSSRRDWLYAVGAGLLFGMAVLTKDEGALITVLPLLVTAALGWGPRRSLIMLTVAATAAVYAAYLGVVAANGLFAAFWQAKTYGIQRMIGLVQISGFHSAGGGSLSARLSAEVSVFWTTYLVVLLAVPAALLVLRRRARRPRILVLVCGAAALTLAYAVAFGTLEEQELYLLALPSLMIIAVAAEPLLRAPFRRWPAAVTIVTLGLGLGLNAETCVRWARQPDTAFVQVFRYVTAHIPAGTVVGAVDGDINTPYALENEYRVGTWDTAAALSAASGQYLVVEWGTIAQGYSSLSLAQVRRLVAHDRPVFSATGRTNGLVVLYQLPSPVPVPAMPPAPAKSVPSSWVQVPLT